MVSQGCSTTCGQQEHSVKNIKLSQGSLYVPGYCVNYVPVRRLLKWWYSPMMRVSQPPSVSSTCQLASLIVHQRLLGDLNE